MLRAAVVIVIASLAGATTARAGVPSLYVNYDGDNCTFAVTNDAGSSVTTLAPGTYQVVVLTHDPYGLTGSCNGYVQFRMTGPGVTLLTTLDDGDSTEEVDAETFQAGATYALQDDGNVSATHMTIAVATSGSPPTVQSPGGSSTKTTSTPSPAVTTTRGAVEGLVAKSGAVSITTRAGKPVTSLKTGRWTFSVHDESATHGFSVQKKGATAQALTAARYVGWRDVAIQLLPGRWTVFSGAGAKKTFFVTS